MYVLCGSSSCNCPAFKSDGSLAVDLFRSIEQAERGYCCPARVSGNRFESRHFFLPTFHMAVILQTLAKPMQAH
jgi:hypothetical protein